jgi:hypothetical protein
LPYANFLIAEGVGALIFAGGDFSGKLPGKKFHAELKGSEHG